MGRLKKLYQKADSFVKKNKPLLKKVGRGIDKYAGKAIAAGEMAETVAPYTGALAPIVGGAGAALMVGGVAAKGGKYIADNAANWYKNKRQTVNKIRNVANKAKQFIGHNIGFA